MRRFAAILAVWLAACGASAEPEALAVVGGRLQRGDEPLGLFGAALTDSATYWARSQRASQFMEPPAALAEHGFNALRVPVSVALLQPAPGVFPGDPQYPVELAQHGLGARYAACLDALVAEAEARGVYLVLEPCELPCDEFRWFTGGDPDRRHTGHPGGGLDWMASPDDVAAGLPALLAWMAEHWRGRAAIAAFVVPFVPHGEGEPELGAEDWLALAGECAAAVHAVDGGRLVALVPPGDGSASAGPQTLLTAPLSTEIDLLMPRLHLGPNLPAATCDDAYAVGPAAWLSWFGGLGRPVVVGGCGPQVSALGWPPAFDSTPDAARRLYDACLAGWLAQGAQGAFLDGWQGGLDDPLRSGRVIGAPAAALKFAEAYRRPEPRAPLVALVGSLERRGADGRRAGLLALARLLTELGVAPYDTIFAEAAAVDPARLCGDRAVLVDAGGLSPELYGAVRAAAPAGLDVEPGRVDVEAVRAYLLAAGVPVEREPYPVWRFDRDGRTVLYNWTGAPASVGLEVAEGERRGNIEDGELLEPRSGVARLFVPPWSAREIRRLDAEEALASDDDAPADRLPPLLVKLYERGPVRGRWLEGWHGAGASLRRVEDGREVIYVRTEGLEQLVRIGFDRHRPVPLRAWHRLPDAELQLLLRYRDPAAAIEVRLEGDDRTAVAIVGARPSYDWQVVSVPLSELQPRGVPELLAGIALRFVPGGSAEVGAFWLTRSPVE